MTKIKVALIGAGRIGMLLEKDKLRIKPATHFGMWMNNKQTELIAVCDKNSESKKYLRQYKNIKFYYSADEMLKSEKIDIVSICTWKDTHFAITKKCINYGIKTIVLEKPLVTNIRDGQNLINLSKKKSIKILINHRRRYDTEIIKLKSKIKNNIIGQIKNVSCQYVYGIQATGTHVIDTLRMLLCDVAGEVEYVIGLKNHFKNFCSKDDENLDFILIFKNGLNVYAQCLNIKDYDIFDFNIYGEKGKISISGIGRDISMQKIIRSPEHENFTELDRKKKYICKNIPRPQFKELAKNAVECHLNKNKPFSSDIDSYKALCIIEKIRKSVKSNSKKIKITF